MQNLQILFFALSVSLYQYTVSKTVADSTQPVKVSDLGTFISGW